MEQIADRVISYQQHFCIHYKADSLGIPKACKWECFFSEAVNQISSSIQLLRCQRDPMLTFFVPYGKKKKILTSTLTAYEAVTSFPWG